MARHEKALDLIRLVIALRGGAAVGWSLADMQLRFRAAGLQEMAFHVFAWGGKVEVLEPKELRELLSEFALDVAAAHGDEGSGGP